MSLHQPPPTHSVQLVPILFILKDKKLWQSSNSDRRNATKHSLPCNNDSAFHNPGLGSNLKMKERLSRRRGCVVTS